MFQAVQHADKAKVFSDPLRLPVPNPKQQPNSNIPSGPATSSLSSLVGFNATFLQFASSAGIEHLSTAERNKTIKSSLQKVNKVTTVNIVAPDETDALKFSPLKERRTEARSLVELRNYTAQMDHFTSFTFNIYGGKAVRLSPEFVAYQRKFSSDFGAISTLIKRLEMFCRDQGVKNAVVNGKALHELAILNAPYIPVESLLSCILNLEQIQPTLSKKNFVGGNVRNRAATKIQSYVRKKIAFKNYRHIQSHIKYAVKIQALFRAVIQRIRSANRRSRLDGSIVDKQYEITQERLRSVWNTKTSKRKLFIQLPSVPTDAYIRHSMAYIDYIHNAHISCLWQLVDPSVSIVFLSPINLGSEIVVYYEKFLSLLGVSLIPRRFHFLVPEAQSKLPSQLSLTDLLWYSSKCLNKIKLMSTAYEEILLIPTGLTPNEQRISAYLDAPLLGPNPRNSDILRSRSFTKRVFTTCRVNIPIGAHDITCEEDVQIALVRLIVANMDVDRWTLRLNSDHNNESVVYFNVERLPLVILLRIEKAQLIKHNKGNSAVWFSAPVQQSARRRLMQTLMEDFPAVACICQPTIYTSWRSYCRHIESYGAVMEAEPKEMSHINGMCFITPIGEVESVTAVNVFTNESGQQQSYIYPQSSVPERDILEVMQTVGAHLYSTYAVIGYVTIYFTAYCNSADGLTRMYGQGLHLGNTPVFGAIGCAAALGDSSLRTASSSFCPAVPKG